MNDHNTTSGRFGTVASQGAQRNKVLSNTYRLLALSMIPTVLGAWVGVQTGITAGLSEPGKLILVLVMICGRLGPLTLAFMLARPVETRIKYPEEGLYTG